jgi:hypothetical protein
MFRVRVRSSCSVFQVLRSRFGCLAFFAAAIALTTSSDARQSTPLSPLTGRRFALLVGVTDFIAPAMKKHNLQGPANDVALFRTVLIGERFRVPADSIVSLAGVPDDQTARPTRANIEREFRRLRDLAGPGDHVMVLLAGHGSQQPANPDPNDEEPDGLDEIFLPADATGWDRSSSRVTNAIVDDEIREWVGAIRNKGAVVSIIVDACHSGTITRAGGTNWRERGIPVAEWIGTTPLPGNPAVQSRAFELSSTAGEIAALYAADVIEATPELPMPDRNGPVHGLFTYTVTRVLSESTGPISYRELVQRVIDRYRAEGFGPTPALEGAAADREVLGERTARDRPMFFIDAPAGTNRRTLTAGSVHGLTQGSILEVFAPNAAAGAKPFGHVRVVEVRPTNAVVQPVAFAKMPAPQAAAIVSGSRARVRHHEFGRLRLRVAAQQPAKGSLPSALNRALSSLQTLSEGLAEQVSSPDADWYIGVNGSRVILTAAPRTAPLRSDTVPASGVKRFDVGALDDTELPSLLGEQLKKISRASNLSRLSSYVDPEADLEIDVMRFTAADEPGKRLLEDSAVPRLKAGDSVQFIVRNTGKVPLDVTLLYVDANFGIIPIFPRPDQELDNRIEAGSQRALPRETISADPLGWESVVAIGVESTPRHENFRLLAQESLPEALRSGDSPRSPLRMLLESALHGTRSGATGTEDDRGRFAISQTWFSVEAAER